VATFNAMSFFIFSTFARAASLSYLFPSILLRTLKKLNTVTAEDRLNPEERSWVLVKRFVVGSIDLPELTPPLAEMLAEGICMSLLCLRLSSARRAWMSACFTEILFARAYSTDLLRFHESCAHAIAE
jgi:hypothetical protein